MIGSGADDPNLDPVLLVPSSKSVYDIDAISGVQVVNGSFAVDLPNLLPLN